MAFDPRVSRSGEYRAEIQEQLRDPVSAKLMTHAVTLIPCGHVFNESTVIQYLAHGRLCPLDKRGIARYVPNYRIRHLVRIESVHPGEEPPSAEAQSYFAQAKQHADEENYELAVSR